jgi:hypothetical protein
VPLLPWKSPNTSLLLAAADRFKAVNYSRLRRQPYSSSQKPDCWKDGRAWRQRVVESGNVSYAVQYRATELSSSFWTHLGFRNTLNPHLSHKIFCTIFLMKVVVTVHVTGINNRVGRSSLAKAS